MSSGKSEKSIHRIHERHREHMRSLTRVDESHVPQGVILQEQLGRVRTETQQTIVGDVSTGSQRLPQRGNLQYVLDPPDLSHSWIGKRLEVAASQDTLQVATPAQQPFSKVAKRAQRLCRDSHREVTFSIGLDIGLRSRKESEEISEESGSVEGKERAVGRRFG